MMEYQKLMNSLDKYSNPISTNNELFKNLCQKN